VRRYSPVWSPSCTICAAAPRTIDELSRKATSCNSATTPISSLVCAVIAIGRTESSSLVCAPAYTAAHACIHAVNRRCAGQTAEPLRASFGGNLPPHRNDGAQQLHSPHTQPAALLSRPARPCCLAVPRCLQHRRTSSQYPRMQPRFRSCIHERLGLRKDRGTSLHQQHKEQLQCRHLRRRGRWGWHRPWRPRPLRLNIS
jgi:hypothetical protein